MNEERRKKKGARTTKKEERRQTHEKRTVHKGNDIGVPTAENFARASRFFEFR